MQTIRARFKNLYKNYLLGLVLKKNTAARFWYLPESHSLKTKGELNNYLSSKYPIYLMDYRSKLNYTLKNKEGIIVLDYGDSIGCQINPEAAFQFGLALWDASIREESNLYKKHFLHYADYFYSIQKSNGTWDYEFDWFESKKPWGSALAQSRGASLMLRAWILTNDDKYKLSAINAYKQFHLDIHDGGYLAKFFDEDIFYFEEYPKAPSAVLNGFMACLLGLWEMNTWLDEFNPLYQRAIATLEKMLPYYTTKNWTLYDLDHRNGQKNLNSPRYHLLIISYLSLLTLIHPSSIFKKYLELWQAQYTIVNRFHAVSCKIKRKIFYK